MCPLSLRPSPTSCSPSFLTTIHLVSPLILSVASSGLTLHLVLPFIPNDQSVKRTDRSSSALTTARPSSLTWSSWWSSTSSTKGCCLANWDTRAPLWPYDLFQRPDTSPTTAHNVIFSLLFCVGFFVYIFLVWRSGWMNWCFRLLFFLIFFTTDSAGDCWANFGWFCGLVVTVGWTNQGAQHIQSGARKTNRNARSFYGHNGPDESAILFYFV